MDNRKPKRMVWLDSVRGLAILIVLTVHIIQAVPKYHDAVSGCGKIGVWLLFLLTGFFTFRPYLIYDEKEKSRDIKNFMSESSSGIKQYVITSFRFYLKRMIRIYPAFFVVLVLSVVIGYLGVAEAVKNFLLVEGTGHFWTLPVEMKFYLITPVFGLVFQVIRKKEYRGLLLVVTALLFSGLFFYKNCPENSIQLGWYLPVLLFGGVLNCFICNDHENLNERTVSYGMAGIKPFMYDTAAVIIVLGFFLMVPGIRYLIFGIPVSRYLSDKYLYLSLLWMIFLFSLDRSEYIRPLLEKSRILPFFGKISYSLYLVHYIVIQHLGSFMEDQKLKSLMALIISLILSVILERTVERPVMKLSKKLFR
ncbi:putative acyltransferase [Lachnospiraceae bacterium JC7]|nr:putative acyltransferase [Lachnospiraceae bacterium JC7]